MADTIWVISNRRDDRVVFWETDNEHPGGEAFIGGSAPAQVARTGAIEALLRSGVIVEIPEPPDGPKKPLPMIQPSAFPAAANPGQPIPLGRVMDPDIVPPNAEFVVGQRQEKIPAELPVPAGVTMPPPLATDATENAGIQTTPRRSGGR